MKSDPREISSKLTFLDEKKNLSEFFIVVLGITGPPLITYKKIYRGDTVHLNNFFLFTYVQLDEFFHCLFR